jgi:hypothetical protein
VIEMAENKRNYPPVPEGIMLKLAGNAHEKAVVLAQIAHGGVVGEPCPFAAGKMLFYTPTNSQMLAAKAILKGLRTIYTPEMAARKLNLPVSKGPRKFSR